MAIDEQTRYEIYEAFKGSYGEKVANGVMELLPPVGWADVATKHDLAALEERIDLRFQVVDREFAALRNEMAAGFATLEAKLDARFAQIDTRFAEVDTRLERAVRRQSTKFVAWLFAGLTLSGAAQSLFA